MTNEGVAITPTFRQLVNNLAFLIEEAPDAEVYLADLENVADDLDTTVYWVEKAIDFLEQYGPTIKPVRVSQYCEHGGYRSLCPECSDLA